MAKIGWGFFAIVFCFLPSLVGAETGDSSPEASPITDFEYRVIEGESEITGYWGKGGIVVIPATIEGLPVKWVGPCAFYQRTGLTSISLPPGVLEIRGSAFQGCSDLSYIDLPDSLESIWGGAFSDCGRLTEVSIPKNVKLIGDGVFAGCDQLVRIGVDPENSSYSGLDGVLFNNERTVLLQYPQGLRGAYSIPDGVTGFADHAFWRCEGLTSVSIPESVGRIEDWTFAYCSGLETIEIGAGVASIARNAFAYCDGLVRIIVGEGNQTYSSLDGVLFNKDRTILLQCPRGYSGDYVVPDGVTVIDDAAFSQCKRLKSVEIANGILTIGALAFSSCTELTEVEIPDGVRIIHPDTFNECRSLANLFIPDSVEFIDDGAFSGCSSLEQLVIPDSVQRIGYAAFQGCRGLTEVELGSRVASIGVGAFSGCSRLTRFLVAEANSQFHSFDGVLFDKEMRSLLECPQGKAGLYTIPEGIVSIEEDAFGGCRDLTWIDLPETLAVIGKSAFGGCQNLTRIEIPPNVTHIGEYAFVACSRLSHIAVDPANTVYSSSEGGTLLSKDRTVLIGCPPGKTGDYSVPESVTTIGEGAFYFCEGLTRVRIPDKTTTIGGLAFLECSNLGSVVCGTGVATIGEAAFLGCRNLSGVCFAGDAPNLESYWVLDSPSHVYYLPGAKGWGGKLGGRPATEWNVKVDWRDAPPGIRTDEDGNEAFGFSVSGSLGLPAVVEVCEDLSHPVWTILDHINIGFAMSPLDGRVSRGARYEFVDPDWQPTSSRFYRVRFP